MYLHWRDVVLPVERAELLQRAIARLGVKKRMCQGFDPVRRLQTNLQADASR